MSGESSDTDTAAQTEFRDRQRRLERERRIREATCCAPGGPPGMAAWEGRLTERDLDEMMAAGEPVELADELVEDVIAGFEAGGKGVTRAPDEKRRIVAWLTESGFHTAAEALTGWPGPGPKPMVQRLREAHELLDWLRNYSVLSMMVHGRPVTGIECARHGCGSGTRNVTIVPGTRAALTLDALFDHAAAHEIHEHGDRDGARGGTR